MFIASLFIVAPNWKLSKYPSIGEWLNKLWYIYTIEYNTEIQRNAPLMYTTWMSLKGITLREKKPIQNNIYCRSPFI